MNNHLKIIYNYILLHVSGKENIKDIVQETLLAIWQSINKYNGDSSFRTWYISITKNKIADFYRNSYKKATIPLTDVEEFLISDNDFDDINNKLTINNSAASLNKSEKDIVFMVFSAQLSYAEVSEVTGLPIGTIKSKMSTVKSKLRKQLENGGGI